MRSPQDLQKATAFILGQVAKEQHTSLSVLCLRHVATACSLAASEALMLRFTSSCNSAISS